MWVMSRAAPSWCAKPLTSLRSVSPQTTEAPWTRSAPRSSELIPATGTIVVPVSSAGVRGQPGTPARSSSSEGGARPTSESGTTASSCTSQMPIRSAPMALATSAASASDQCETFSEGAGLDSRRRAISSCAFRSRLFAVARSSVLSATTRSSSRLRRLSRSVRQRWIPAAAARRARNSATRNGVVIQNGGRTRIGIEATSPQRPDSLIPWTRRRRSPAGRFV